MEVLPVIDLMGGVVMRAHMGRREAYRPIATPLARTSDPADVVRGLLALYPFERLYVADLDAIGRRGDNRAALRRLNSELALDLWVDSGIGAGGDAQAWLDAGLGALVLGSESQTDPKLVRQLAPDARVVLSLDFRDEAFCGPPALLAEPDAWPRRVIVMTLARVGSGTGPDLRRIAAIREIAAGRAIYAAGGVRDAADLEALAQAGAAGALVASCLHDGRLTRPEIAALTATHGCAGGRRLSSAG
jgi:phosphoribosylformimino-5-aminoimidazole carboxamide ribotide isomerase